MFGGSGGLVPGSTERRPGVVLDTDIPFQPSIHLIVLYDVFHLIGLVSLTVVFLTCWLSPRIKRASTWLLFIFSWIFTSIANLMLVGYQTRPSVLPSVELCLGQAMLRYAAPVFSSFCALSCTLDMYLVVLSTQSGYTGPSLMTNSVIFSLHTIPCLMLVGTALMIMIMGIVDTGSIERDPSGMYCHLKGTLPGRIIALFIILAMSALLVVAVLIFRRHLQAKREARHPKDYAHIPLNMTIRIFAFCILAMLSLGVSTLNFLSAHTNPVRQYSKTNVVVASLPTAAGLIFGTQKDLLRVWACRPAIRRSLRGTGSPELA